MFYLNFAIVCPVVKNVDQNICLLIKQIKNIFFLFLLNTKFKIPKHNLNPFYFIDQLIETL